MGEIGDRLKVPAPTLTAHLNVLRHAGLVRDQREGRVIRCRADYARLRDLGVEFTQEPVDRYGNVDAGFRDPAGNGWKMIQLAAGGVQ